MEGREDEVARQGGLDGNLSCLEVSNLSDEDNIGILAQEGSECCGKVQADILFHLNIIV